MKTRSKTIYRIGYGILAMTFVAAEGTVATSNGGGLFAGSVCISPAVFLVIAGLPLESIMAALMSVIDTGGNQNGK